MKQEGLVKKESNKKFLWLIVLIAVGIGIYFLTQVNWDFSGETQESSFDFDLMFNYWTSGDGLSWILGLSVILIGVMIIIAPFLKKESPEDEFEDEEDEDE